MTFLDRIGLAALGLSLFCYFVTMLVFWIPHTVRSHRDAEAAAVNTQQLREDLEKCGDEMRELRRLIERLTEQMGSRQ